MEPFQEVVDSLDTVDNPRQRTAAEMKIIVVPLPLDHPLIFCFLLHLSFAKHLSSDLVAEILIPLWPVVVLLTAAGGMSGTLN